MFLFQKKNHASAGADDHSGPQGGTLSNDDKVISPEDLSLGPLRSVSSR